MTEAEIMLMDAFLTLMVDRFGSDLAALMLSIARKHTDPKAAVRAEVDVAEDLKFPLK